MHRWCRTWDRCWSAGLLQGVLSLWKLRVGVEAYYLAQVASGLDEYYTGSGEAVGGWTGHGIAGLGLTGTVDPADLRAVLAGLAPGTGLTPNGETNRPHARRVPGFDLTFSVPKSVSVLYALGDPLVQGTVIEAAETALADTLAWLEREAVFVRRGSNDQTTKAALGEGWGTRRMVTGGMVAARFRHRSSRAGDPHLHWHVLVANLAQGVDGRWSALDGTALYGAKRTAGVMFQTVLRQQLSERLGVEWTPTRNDAAEVAGIPRRVLKTFSQRREQMDEWLEANGRTGPAAADEAMLATRTAKPSTDLATLTAAWHQRATEAGFSPADLDRLLSVGRVPADGTPERWLITSETDDWEHGSPPQAVAFEEWLDHTLESRLTGNNSTFTRFDLSAAIAAARSGASIDRIERLADRALASPLIVAIDSVDPTLVGLLGHIRDDRARRYTSRRLLDLEASFLAQISAEREVDPIDARIVTEALRVRPTLGLDQANALQLLSQPDAVQVMVGRPGTGKTYTLGALHDVYRQAGRQVIGLAPSARAARELETGSGIGSHTIASFLLRSPTLDGHTVVVVDEAGMAGTRDLAAVVDRVTATGAKVILVGDPHQLAEVSAGGAFRAALDTLTATPGLVCELTVNRRQQHRWEHDALDQLRAGDIPAAWAAYKTHDRVTLTDSPDELHRRLVADWRQLTDTPLDGRPASVVVLAGTRAETVALNRAIRADRAAHDELSGEGMKVGDRVFHVGDRVVLLRNDRHQTDDTGESVSVDNGMVATITTLDPTTGAIEVRVDGSDRHITLDPDYVAAGHVEWGYALTVHKAQGLTCDHVLIAGPHGLNREAGYVALSRARHSARLYATVRQDLDLTERHTSGIPLPAEADLDPEAELVARLRRSSAKHLATTLNPDARRVDDLATTHNVAELLTVGECARWVRDTAPCPEPDTTTVETAIAFRSHAAVGRRVRAFDRDNVGTIESLDDRHGTATVQFQNTAGRSSTRTVAWAELLVIDDPQPVTLPADAVTRLEGMVRDVEWRRGVWVEHHRRHGIEPGDADRCTAALGLVVERAARSLRSEPPDWLQAMLGDRPGGQARAVVWDDTVHRIAHWRTHHHVAPNTVGLGPAPDDPETFTTWHRMSVELLDTAAYLAAVPHVADRRASLAPSELLERRDELRRLLDTAPPVDRAVVDQLLAARSDTTQLHEHLAQAATARGLRARWILEHWPHIVELEQLDRLAANLDPTPQRPAAQPAEVDAVLEVLRRIPPIVTEHEPRSLGELARAEADANPVVRLQRRLNELEARTAELNRRLHSEPWANDPAAQATLRHELQMVGAEHGDIQRAHYDEALLYGYVGPSDTFRRARMVRAANITHQALHEQPAWVVDHVRALHDQGTLAKTSIAELAERLSTIAVGLDGDTHAARVPEVGDAELRPVELAPDVPGI